MPKGVVVQELVWESSEAIPRPPCSSSKGVCCTTRDAPGEERSGESLKHVASDMLGEERSPWGRGPKILVFPVLPATRYLGLSDLLLLAWPIISVLLTSV